MKPSTNRTTSTRNVVDSRKGLDRLAIGVESTLARYIRAIHAQGTVGYGASQARDLLGIGGALQIAGPRQALRAGAWRLRPGWLPPTRERRRAS